MPGHLSFSFRYLDTTPAKFSLAGRDHHFFEMIFGKLKALSEKTRQEFQLLPVTGGKAWRVHRIKWNEVSERSFGLPITLTADENAYQFTISRSNGRVHGFLLGSVFFMRWIDPGHQLYNGNPE